MTQAAAAVSAELIAHLDGLLGGRGPEGPDSRGGRIMLGLAGAPGAGKSTFALQLQAAYAECAQVVPMDGFHLANAELHRLGCAHRKGAPDTFDTAGYLALLQRLRSQPADQIVYAPQFMRELEESIAGAIAVLPATRLIITEGNYLLLDDGPWALVRDALDEVWFVEVDDALREQRLVARHVHFGRSPQAAREWVDRSDAVNARLIAATRDRADRVVML